MEKVNFCPLCGSKKIGLYLLNVTSWEYKGKFDFLKCLKCKLVFVNPRPKHDDLHQYYSAASYWGKDIRKQAGQSFDSAVWQQEKKGKYGFLYKEIFRLFPRPGKILDIGCGTGGFLKELANYGWQVLGNEISKDAANYSKKSFRFQILVGDFLKVNFSPQKFNLIVLNNVLEHLDNPNAVIKKANSLLRPQGFLVIVTPNSQSLGEAIFGRDWYCLHPGRHLYLFSLPTLSLLLRENRLKMIICREISGHHNFYSFFESFRFKLSPKFRKGIAGGLSESVKKGKPGLGYRLVKEPAKLFFKILSVGLVFLGAVLKKGEMLTIYAKKA